MTPRPGLLSPTGSCQAGASRQQGRRGGGTRRGCLHAAARRL